MNTIEKVSDIAAADLAEYLRIPEVTANDTIYLNNLLAVATNYITKYTGQTELDNFPDFVIVVFVLVQDMYDNRTLYPDRSNLNFVVDSILGLHSINLLPTETDDD